MVGHTSSPSIHEAEAGGLRVQSQHELCGDTMS
jgi:hypothetical protein